MKKIKKKNQKNPGTAPVPGLKVFLVLPILAEL